MENKMKRWIDNFILIALAAILVGCGSSTQRPWKTLKDCAQKNTELSIQIQALESENTQLTEQVNTLSTLDAAARLEALDTLDKIRIGKRTGFYDKDDDSTNETLVVYLEPLDMAQDFVKAIGGVKIQLWDLDTAANEAKPVEWTLEPADLHPTWGGTIFAGYYRIKLPLENFSDQKKDYTVKVSFTDYLSGKVLTDQKVISVQ
jgi:outer membrane murein-binding lipoprotein Lpp